MKQFMFLLFFLGISLFGSGQELSNEKYQKIIVMDGEKAGWLEIFVDPLDFDCSCDEVIKAIVKKTNQPSVYKSDDGVIKLEIKGEKHIVTILNNTECCFLRPGVYTMN